MAAPIVARNYADTLLALARKQGGVEAVHEYSRAIEQVTEVLRNEPRVRHFLETPRVSAEAKKEALRASFGGRVPEMFLRFLLVVVEKRRQALLLEIAVAYHQRVDELLGRVRADIALAQEPDEPLRDELVRALEGRLGRTVVPTFRVDPSLIGGVVIRVGDEVYDGSLRHQLTALRRRLYEVHVPHAAAR